MIDLNADMGEYRNASEQENETLIFPHISRCNIACGGHAGDKKTMAYTIKQALKYDVICGAHPSYPDRENFGRQAVSMTPDALETTLVQQIDTLRDVALANDTDIKHIKAHGALYHDATVTRSSQASLWGWRWRGHWLSSGCRIQGFRRSAMIRGSHFYAKGLSTGDTWPMAHCGHAIFPTQLSGRPTNGAPRRCTLPQANRSRRWTVH